MKMVLGVSLILFGIGVWGYCGLYWAFIGGIIGVIEQVRAPSMDNYVLAWEILKIVLAGPIGFIVGIPPMVFGKVLVESK